jgi:hypothetical protein
MVRWSLILLNGFLIGTRAMPVIPPALDVAAACLTKCMPIYDGWYLTRIMRKVLEQDNSLESRHVSVQGH